ncbi:MAG: FAD-binding protein [Mailhella sp.]|nr:FAD-binding protein [Mailhella sp.]
MKIIDRPALAELTTLRLGGSAIAEIRLDSLADCERLPEALSLAGGSAHVLGGGSNLLIRDGELPITVIRPLMGSRDAEGRPAEPEVLGAEDGPDGKYTLLRVGAGMRMPFLLSWTVRRGLAGLEGLVGVPGRVGGAVAMNAGSYGCSTAPLMRSLTVFTPERGLHEIGPEGWEASYRRFSLVKPCSWYMSASVVLAMKQDDPAKLRRIMQENFLRKKSGQPVHEHTAGCVFKNPEGESAGRLLDAAGMKGRRRGALRFSEMHANFLAHDTKCGIPGRTEDALALIAEARAAVQERFGVSLEMEVKEWPAWR